MSDIETKTALDGDTASSPISVIMTDETPQKTQADVTDEDRKRAELYKSEGNQLWAEHHYQQAIDAYTKAIELDPFNAVYYSNRAMCHMKLENYGLALADGSKSIECDASYIKGYYRRGAAYLAMGKYKDGLKDFKHVAKIKPNDKDAQTKLKECQKAVRAEAFNAAIENEKSKPASELYDYKTIDVESSYDGPRYDEQSDLNPTFIQQLLDHFKAQKRLHRKYVYRIVLEAIKLLSSLPTLIEIDIPENDQLTVCGDVHGQFYDLLNIFAINGIPSEKNPYLFNGDFVDRGSFSLEIIVSFFALKLLYPTRFHLLRGNHESLTMNQIYGFQGEVQSKVDGNCFALFSECFNYLPLAAVIGEKVLVVHGGLFSEDGVKLEDIKKINRNCQPPEKGLMCELMWSDPQPQKGRAPSKRGVGLSFGPDVTHRFLKDNKLDLIVRSHEVKEEGYQVEADGKLITVFSAPNYCDSMGNKGAFIKFGPSLKPEFTKFTAVPHPAVQPMAYASSMFRM